MKNAKSRGTPGRRRGRLAYVTHHTCGTVQPERKILNKKGEQIGSFTEADVQRDKREEQQWLKKGDLTADACEAGREAAYEERNDEELCLELIDKWARKSAKRKGGNIGEIRDRYEMIVLEFLAARYTEQGGERYSLGSALRSDYETDGKLKEFLAQLLPWIEAYALRCIRGLPQYHWKLNGSGDVRAIETLHGHVVSKDMMTVLGVEYVRDREGLKRFLSAIFKRWRKIYKFGSLWQVVMVRQQIRGQLPRHSHKAIAERIENSSVFQHNQTEKQHDKLIWKIKQYLSPGRTRRERKKEERTPKTAVTKPRRVA